MCYHICTAMKSRIEKIFEKLGIPLIQNQSLADLTSFRIGGFVRFYAEINNSGILKSLLPELAQFSLHGNSNSGRQIETPVYLIGSGTNLLPPDRDENSLVIAIKGGDAVTVSDNTIIADAAVPLCSVVQVAANSSVAGLEFLAGIPGTFGGAVAGNAGAFGKSVSELLVWADVWMPGTGFMRLKPEDMAFDYRKCGLADADATIVSAALRGQIGDSAIINAEITRNKEFRRFRHPARTVPCAGSFFKNPPPVETSKRHHNPGKSGRLRRQAAGELLDIVGAKGMRVRDAQVWPGHANFIINTGSATCRDVEQLADTISGMVRERFGIQLEREVRSLRNRNF